MKTLRLLATASLAPVAATAGTDSELKIDIALARSRIELGQQTQLTVTVSGPSGFSEPVVPDIDGLGIVLQGRTQSVQIINMKVKSSKIFGYVIVPRKVGRFKIGPVQIERGGQIYKSSTALLTVADSGQPQKDAKRPQSVIVEASVDNANPYVGQQITLLFRFARKATARIRNAGYQMPDLSDFWTEGMESKHEYSQRMNEADYLVTQVAVPLFAVKEGEIEIGRITFHYDEAVSSRPSHRGSPRWKWRR